ncbi:integrase core domain-containing protein [Verminephrobacter eiseniae]|uniref:integrase core domain-containing protein n=1 Tax=Verminephrobacter eiseniae TaxID=364317 RepID=UPI00223826B3|nr:integrase core domain-containing protein [Verminephrobacter eiseniae]
MDTGLDDGVAERFNRTMKEQAIHGRIFKSLEEVRAATIAFRDRYNRDRRLGELGFKSPLEARQERLMKLAARAAKACPNNRSRYMQRWPHHSQQTTHSGGACR